MGSIKVLDCTLRDGGYCNEWAFGRDNIDKIVTKLVEAGIDIIECGFLTNKIKTYNPDVSRYPSIGDITPILPKSHDGYTFVCMANYGECDAESLPECDGSSVDGIRVAFHKKDVENALSLCRRIREKGYKLFIQAMVSLNYSDSEFLQLISKVNELHPYAFYIVDSFGVMKRKDLIRLFYMVEHNLNRNITIGYHSHNNMQLSYSNAQALVDLHAAHDMIIDSSVLGMGRGAGNLNTELFVEYLNDTIGSQYKLKPLLSIIDEVLNRFHQQNPWGYSLPNYLSAKHNAHPNYAGYLDSKKTLTVENMDEIFGMMEPAKRAAFDKAYIEELYVTYLANRISWGRTDSDVNLMFKGKEVLFIAPGPSSLSEKDKIMDCARKAGIVTIGINFDYQVFDTDFIFLSNLRRYRELDVSKHPKCIVTSNIPSQNTFYQADYLELLNDEESVKDNAGMMLIRFLIKNGAKKIFIAGLDGYSTDSSKNFADPKMNFYTQNALLEAMNHGMTELLKKFKHEIELEFITTQHYVTL